ncbi:hypothetical protein LBMAG47_19470 [Planctomycetia bacterium]|nr:hypothetical protein LBMAG47_19470 [Planctomycetia bacterium]
MENHRMMGTEEAVVFGTEGGLGPTGVPNTNAVAEGRNGKIMAIKHRAGDYRNVENFTNVIYFYCGGLRRYP